MPYLGFFLGNIKHLMPARNYIIVLSKGVKRINHYVPYSLFYFSVFTNVF